MTDAATKARENASHCEAKKHALRQTQDGIVVSFVLHPNDVPAALQLAPLGTRYLLALVEIGEDEKPLPPLRAAIPARGSRSTQEDTTAASAAYAHTQTQPAPAHAPTVPPARVRPPAQLAGILCAKPAFWKFAQERGHPEVVGEETAKLYIRAYCGVASRADIKSGTEAEQRLNLMLSAFKVWDLAPSCGAAA